MGSNTFALLQKRTRLPLLGYLWSIGTVALATAVLLVLHNVVGLETANISLGYIVAVLLVAVWNGLGPGVVASVLSFAVYNYWFVPPLYTFTVTDPQDLVRLLVFLGAAVFTSSIAARARSRAQEAQRRTAVQEALYALSLAISTEVEVGAILPVVAQQVERLLPIRGCQIQVIGADVAPLATESGEVGNEGMAVSMPLQIGARTLGLIRVWEFPDRPLDTEGRRLLEALARQAALAVERTRLVDEATKLQLVAESEHLKSAILHSVSHDLRTPLVAIKGAVSNLLDSTVDWDANAQQTFLETIDLEADRLNRLVRNLLDMSRIEAGASLPPLEPALFEDVLGPVLYRLKSLFAAHPIEVDLPPDLPLVPMAMLQVDQILANLIENAAKYSPAGSPISISAAVTDGFLQADIADRGPGVPIEERERVFDKFYRLGEPETTHGGTGLGLSICKFWVEAHGGSIWVRPRPGGGAVFSFRLPLSRVETARIPADPAYPGLPG